MKWRATQVHRDLSAWRCCFRHLQQFHNNFFFFLLWNSLLCYRFFGVIIGLAVWLQNVWYCLQSHCVPRRHEHMSSQLKITVCTERAPSLVAHSCSSVVFFPSLDSPLAKCLSFSRNHFFLTHKSHMFWNLSWLLCCNSTSLFDICPKVVCAIRTHSYHFDELSTDVVFFGESQRVGNPPHSPQDWSIITLILSFILGNKMWSFSQL